VVLGKITEMPELEKILTAHPLLHTAEGVLFRQVFLLGAAACGMKAVGVPERTIVEKLPRQWGQPISYVLPRLTEMGRGLGSPWTLDQKYAAAAALLALGG
jgi:hypothetical protein